MRKKYFAIAFVGFLSLVSYAQKGADQVAKKPNFTGTWEFQGEKSYIRKNWLIVISHIGDELTLAERFEFEKKLISNRLTLFSDQRGERNLLRIPGNDVEIEVKSTTAWKKNKLIRKSTFNSLMTGSTGQFSVVHRETESYILSKDGNSLIVEMIASRDAPPFHNPIISTGKRVYRRRD